MSLLLDNEENICEKEILFTCALHERVSSFPPPTVARNCPVKFAEYDG